MWNTSSRRLLERFLPFVNNNNNKKKNQSKSIKKTLMLGLVLLFGSTIIFLLFDTILDAILDWQLQIKEGNLVYSLWKELPFPMRLRLYVYQIHNGHAFQNGQAWPHISEVGPFYFNEYRKRTIHEWTHDNGVVSYSEHLRFEFDESQSVGSLEQPVTVINTPLICILGFVTAKVKEFHLNLFNPIVTKVLNLIFRFYDEGLIEERTVGEILEGREVGILKLLETISAPLGLLGIEIPEISVGFYTLTKNTFGFVHLRNNQTFGPTEAYTGQTDFGRVDHIYRMNGKRLLPYYRHDSCNRIKGTEGTMFGPHPPNTPNATLYVFNQHVCRSLKFKYQNETVVNSILTYRYVMDRYQFSPSRQRANWCYCPEDEQIGNCEGLLYMRQCLGGTPMVLSMVHFYNAPSALARVQGLRPDPEKHLGYLDVERTMGATVDANIRVQINLDMKPYKSVANLSRFRSVIMPYLWIEEGATIQGHLVPMLAIASNGIQFANVGFVMGAALGLVFITKALLMKLTNRNNFVGDKNVDDDEEDDGGQTEGANKAARPPPINTVYRANQPPPLAYYQHHHRQSQQLAHYQTPPKLLRQPQMSRQSFSRSYQNPNPNQYPNQNPNQYQLYQQQQQQQQPRRLSQYSTISNGYHRPTNIVNSNSVQLRNYPRNS